MCHSFFIFRSGSKNVITVYRRLPFDIEVCFWRPEGHGVNRGQKIIGSTVFFLLNGNISRMDNHRLSKLGSGDNLGLPCVQHLWKPWPNFVKLHREHPSTDLVLLVVVVDLVSLSYNEVTYLGLHRTKVSGPEPSYLPCLWYGLRRHGSAPGLTLV